VNNIKTYNDTRDAIFDELYEIAIGDPNVVVFSADTSAMKFSDFEKNIPNQFYNIGIAEQNAMTTAAGLTRTGKKVFVFGISNFVSLRCFEQVRVDICGMKCPVVILGMGAGYTYAQDGLTHHMTEDMGAMNTLPGLTIWNPSDYTMTAHLIHLAYEKNGPCYLRFDKGPFDGPLDSVYPDEYDFSVGVNCSSRSPIGVDSKKVAIVGTGISTKWSHEIAVKLLKNGIATQVVDLYRIKPLNKGALLDSLEGCQLVVTLEEHNVHGGIGMIVSNAMMEEQLYIPVKKFGVNDRFISEVGDREFLRTINGMDDSSVIQGIKNALQKTG
jgi:transketolase